MSLDPESQERIDSFEEAFNCLSDYLVVRAASLDKKLPSNKAIEVPARFVSFSAALKACKDESDIHPYHDDLLRLSRLRNSITHDSCCNERYMSVPTPAVVSLICGIRNALTKTETCGKAFEQTVEVLSPTDTLAKVSRLILEDRFSQFPVLDDAGCIQLLTENGVVRWMLAHSIEAGPRRLEDIQVRDLLAAEEAKEDILKFAAASEPDYRVAELFSIYPDLRAVFITEDGKESPQIIGVATADDLKGKGV